MTVIVCLCDEGGMMFNNRRQSRDRVLIEDISRSCEDGAMFVSSFSAPLFESSTLSCIEVSNPLESAESGDYAFVENLHLKDYRDKIEGMIIYRWNRSYPHDFELDVYPSELGMSLDVSYEFAGSSHEKITKEVYKR